MLALALAACINSGGQSAAAGYCLVIRQFPSGRALHHRPLPETGRFSLSFVHSVSGTPVTDDYRLIDDRIVQTAESFQTHGAGLPSGIDEPGVTGWAYHADRFVIRMHRPISKLIVRTDRNYRNRLLIGDVERNLNDWPDQALELAAEPCAWLPPHAQIRFGFTPGEGPDGY